MRKSLTVNVAVSVAEKCLLERDSASTHVAVKGSRSKARAQESGGVEALPMQVMCKQWNRGDGTEHVRIILMPALLACCSG